MRELYGGASNSLRWGDIQEHLPLWTPKVAACLAMHVAILAQKHKGLHPSSGHLYISSSFLGSFETESWRMWDLG